MSVEKEGYGRIVSMKGYQKAMAYNPIAEVEAYWEALRGVRMVPLRSEIDPRGIERALDHTFLLERIAPGLARFRLAGQVLNDLMGMEVRGMPLTACVSPDSRDQMRDGLNLLFEGPQVLKIGLKGEGGFGRPTLKGQIVLMPLKSDLGDISRAIGCINLDGKIGRTPRRLEITSTNYVDIGPFKTRQPADDTKPVKPERQGFDEPKPKFEHQNRVAPDRSHLRVIHGDRGQD